MLKDWKIIHEMDNEDGTPTCYARKFGGQQWWVTQHPDRWIAETKVKVFDELEIVSVIVYLGGLVSAAALFVVGLRLVLKLFNRLIDAGCGKTRHDADRNGGDVVPCREVRDAGQHGHDAKDAAGYTANDRNPLVVQAACLNQRADEIRDDGDRRHRCNAKIHFIYLQYL